MDAVQSIMFKHDPDFLVLVYTQLMMGFLFFQPAPKRIEIIGLGGGSLAKYCVKYLPEAHVIAIEINPKVIALRNQFSIPMDNERFQVVCANGADYVRDHVEKVDVLLVDGFKSHGQAASLCNTEFYANCYARLNDGGIMAVNFLQDGEHDDTYLSRIRDCFNDKVLQIDCKNRANKIAFAYKGDHFPPSPAYLQELIDVLSPKHRLPLHNIVEKIALSIQESVQPS
jgi:spermidine synthase